MTTPEELIQNWESHKGRIKKDLITLADTVVGTMYDPPRYSMVMEYDRELGTTFYTFANIDFRENFAMVTQTYMISAIGKSEDIFPYVRHALTQVEHATLICDRRTFHTVRRNIPSVIWDFGLTRLVFSLNPKRVVEVFTTNIQI